MAIADLMLLIDEPNPDGSPYMIFDPENPWKKMTIENYYVEELLVKVFDRGEQVYFSPEIKEIAAYHKRSSASFWEQYKRVTLPEIFKVDLSEKLYETKQKLLAENKG